MADWLVLEKWEGRIASQTVRVHAGTVIDDTQYDVTTMLASGAALVRDNAGYAAATALFNEAFDPTKPEDEGATMLPVLEANGIDVAQAGGTPTQGTELYVDGSFTGHSTGSKDNPAKTYAAAAALAAAGDRIFVRGGTYAEALPLVAGVDIIGLCGPRSGDVQFTGQMTGAFAGTVNVVNIHVTQNVAATMLITGANATLINLFGCTVEVGAAGTFALDCDAANAVIFPWNTVFSSVTGNLNETVLMSAGTLLAEQYAITHADGITGPATALRCDGTGVVDVVLVDFQLQGNVDIASGAQNPTTTFRQGRIATGTQGAIQTNSTGACVTRNVELVSAEANGFAITGTGVFTYAGLVLSGAAVDISPALNAGGGPLVDLGYASVSNGGSVAVAQIIQGGQPIANETLTVGADVYEFDGVGANINVAIQGSAAATMAELLAQAVANGTEPLFWDSPAATVLRLRSADGPQGNILASGPPNIALTEAATNYVFDCGNVNMNTLGGEAQVQLRQSVQTIVMNAGHAASGSCRFSFPFPVTRFLAWSVTAAGVPVAIAADTYLIDNDDVEVILGGGGLVATDVVTIHAFE